MIEYNGYKIGVIPLDMSEFRGKVIDDFIINDSLDVWGFDKDIKATNPQKKILKKAYFMEQIHSNIVHTAKTNEIYDPKCDAIISDESDVALMCLGADCFSVVFVGDKRFGVAHSGRAGVLSGVIENTIKAMNDTNIKAFISVGICKKCYDLEYFDNEKYQSFYQNGCLNLGGIIKSKLKEYKIEFFKSNLCTNCDGFFSYHHSKTHKRFATYVYK